MFRVHEHQIAHFARRLRADFEARMCRYLKEVHPDSFAGMADDEIALWVSSAVSKAVHYGIKTEPEVASLMLLFLVLGVDVDETTPWAREVLVDRGLLPEGKIRKLIVLSRANEVPGIDAVALDEPDEEGDAITDSEVEVETV